MPVRGTAVNRIGRDVDRGCRMGVISLMLPASDVTLTLLPVNTADSLHCRCSHLDVTGIRCRSARSPRLSPGVAIQSVVGSRALGINVCWQTIVSYSGHIKSGANTLVSHSVKRQTVWTSRMIIVASLRKFAAVSVGQGLRTRSILAAAVTLKSVHHSRPPRHHRAERHLSNQHDIFRCRLDQPIVWHRQYAVDADGGVSGRRVCVVPVTPLISTIDVCPMPPTDH